MPKTRFLPPMSPQAKRILIELNKSKKAFAKNLPALGNAENYPIAHDYSHVLPRIVNKYTTGNRMQDLSASPYSENSVVRLLEDQVYSRDSFTRRLSNSSPKPQKYTYSPKGQTSIGTNSKNKPFGPKRIEANTQYQRTMLDNINSHKDLNTAVNATQDIILTAKRRQYPDKPKDLSFIMDEVRMSSSCKYVNFGSVTIEVLNNLAYAENKIKGTLR